MSGDQYQFARQFPDNSFAVQNGPGLKTYHIVNGNQNFYSTPLPGAAAPDAAQRIELIDKLLTAASANQAAVQALQQARARLAVPGASQK